MGGGAARIIHARAAGCWRSLTRPWEIYPAQRLRLIRQLSGVTVPASGAELLPRPPLSGTGYEPTTRAATPTAAVGSSLRAYNASCDPDRRCQELVTSLRHVAVHTSHLHDIPRQLR